MIYFTEITKAAGTGEEKIAFQFLPKELPEVIPMMYSTKINRIEYNGGFITNQIIGTFQEAIEWEGCFFGKYDIGGRSLSAKERAQEVKKFMGRPIRVGFTPAFDAFEYKVGQPDANLAGDKGIYIIEEYEMRVRNFVDVDYKIKLVPHMRQEKIKPMDSDVVIVKVNEEAVLASSVNAGVAGAKSRKPVIKNASNAAFNSAKALGPDMPPNPKEYADILKIKDANERQAQLRLKYPKQAEALQSRLPKVKK
jgi:hypothetical protein